MRIGPLPAALRDIHEDGRSNQEIIAALEARNVAIFQKGIFDGNTEAIPPAGTPYNILATTGSELPADAKSSAERVFEAVSSQRGDLRKASLRLALLLMERMTRERLYADIFVLHEPVLDIESGGHVFITLGREHGEGQSWIAAVAADYAFKFDGEVIVFLGPVD